MHEGNLAIIRKIDGQLSDIDCKCSLIAWPDVTSPHYSQDRSCKIRELTYFCSGKEFKFLAQAYENISTMWGNHVKIDANGSMTNGQDSPYLVK